MTVRARAVLALAIVLSTPSLAYAQVTEDQAKEASVHYRRGVELVSEGKDDAALVEFRRAYATSPNFRVLFNIGQVLVALGDDAGAVRSFEQYLAEGKSEVPADRRADVEASLAKLKNRVGRVTVLSDVEGAEVQVDDVPLGTIPLAAPIVIGVGRHRISIVHDGNLVTRRYIEVAGGDTPTVTLNQPPKAAPVIVTQPGPSTSTPAAAPPPSRTPAIVAWASAGTLLVGTSVTGILALNASRDLKSKRETEGIAQHDLDSTQRSVKTLALVTDVLAGLTVVAGGVATYLTFRPSKSVRVGWTGTGASLAGSF